MKLKLHDWCWLGCMVVWLAEVNSAQAFYNSTTGRWVSRDPIGEQGGVNLHVLTHNVPVSFVDRNGLDVVGLSQTAVSEVEYPSTTSSFRRPIRPSNRDEPPRARCGRRAGSGGGHGDANCKRCGPEVGGALAATLSGVKSRFDALSADQKKNKCSLEYLAGTWDITFPAPPKGCGEGACIDTVMVSGRCYDKWKVNYLLFGYISKLCGFSRAKMEAVVAAQKLIRKPLCDGDWENEYTGDVRGFMKIGFVWDDSLPAELPGPTGGFSGCKPCDKAGANDPKYSSAFPTTWP